MVKPLLDKPPQAEKKENGRISMTRQYELITPLFGGGVKANVVDTDNPIRGTSVRGQLRFWWRAICGGRFDGSLEKMKAAEDEIWGAAGIGSKISVAVIKSEPGKPYLVPQGQNINVGDPNSPLGYVAFPLRDSGGKVYEGVSFTLKIDCPKAYRLDLRSALWAWETFGGIGARNRRGFGALHCIDVQLRIDDKKTNPKNWIWAYSSDNAKKDILTNLEEFTAKGNFPNFTPCLSRDPNHTHTTPAQQDAYPAWLKLINSLKDFRQSRSLKGVGGQMRPFGRSHWPEPDAIRDLTGQSLKSKGHDVPVYNPPIHKFPRAAFGLPIVFEFKDDDQSDPDKDPRKTELKGANYERRASRLVLRPLKCTDGRYVGLATILYDNVTIPPGGLALKNSPKNPGPNAEVLTTTEAAQIKAKHPKYDGSIDILQAFLNQLP